MEHMALPIKGVLATILGATAYWLGGLDNLLLTLVALAALDYITGFLSAIHNKRLSSAIGFKGIAKKVMLFSIVALAFIIENYANGVFALREMVITFFVVNEALSIIENAAEIGLPVPQKMKDILAQLKGKDEGNE